MAGYGIITKTSPIELQCYLAICWHSFAQRSKSICNHGEKVLKDLDINTLTMNATNVFILWMPGKYYTTVVNISSFSWPVKNRKRRANILESDGNIAWVLLLLFLFSKRDFLYFFIRLGVKGLHWKALYDWWSVFSFNSRQFMLCFEKRKKKVSKGFEYLYHTLKRGLVCLCKLFQRH